MALTVTATAGGNTSTGMGMQVFVLTGASLTQTGATWVQSAAAAHNATASTTVTGSRVYGAVLNGAAAAPTPVSAATTLVNSAADAGHTKDYGAWKSTSLTGTPGSAQFGFTDNNNGGIAGCEILPATALAEDASAPAFASTTSATTLSSASFSPPPGALLVACVAANGTTNGTVTMTVTGGGYTWTALAEAHASNMKYAGVFAAVVPFPADTARPVQACIPQNAPRGRVTSGPGTRPALVLVNDFNEGTNGTTLTGGSAGNTAGAGESYFDAISIGSSATVTFDNTQPAHGALGLNITQPSGIASSGFVAWNPAHVGTQPTLWFRFYLYLTAYPTVNARLFAGVQGANLCGALLLLTTGKLLATNTAGGTVFTFTGTVPLNKQVRVEGFLTGNATTGQWQVSQFNIADSQAASETQTSAATASTFGPVNIARFGPSTSTTQTSAWTVRMDDVGVSNTGPLGPASLVAAPSQGQPAVVRFPQLVPRAGRVSVSTLVPAPAAPAAVVVVPAARGPVRARSPQPARGRATGSAGAPLRNPTTGPPVKALAGPVTAKRPLFRLGRTQSLPGAAVRNPVAGPVTYPLAAPVAARQPQLAPRAGRAAASPGAPPRNPTAGPPVRALAGPVRAPVPRTFSKGRGPVSPGAPVRNPTAGPVFRQAARPARAPVPQTWSRGRATGNVGAPVTAPAAVQLSRLNKAVFAQPAAFAKGRTASSRGAPAANPATGRPFPPWHGPAQARQPLPPRGRTVTGGRGAPVTIPPPLFPPAAELHITWAMAGTALQAAPASLAVLTIAASGAQGARLTASTPGQQPATWEPAPPLAFAPAPGPVTLPAPVVSLSGVPGIAVPGRFVP